MSELLVVAPLFSGPNVLGLLLAVALHQELLPSYEFFVVSVGLICLTFGNVLIAYFSGDWIWAHFRKAKAVRSLQVDIFFMATATLGIFLALYEHYRDRLSFNEPILIGTMLAWVFVLGYVINDPLITPILQKLDKVLDSVRTWPRRLALFLIRLPISLMWTIYKALQSIYEAMAAQRAVTSRSNLPAVIPLRSQPLDLPPASSGTTMVLKLKRSQRTAITGKVIFVLDARMEVPAEEYSLIQRYRLGNQIIYDSAARQRHTKARNLHLESTKKDHAGYRDTVTKQLWGVGKTFYRIARAGVSATMVTFSLRVTIYSLMRGVNVECKDMEELLGAEKAIKDAGETLRDYLIVAATFDGQEVILEF
jgi:hypothetical protein